MRGVSQMVLIIVVLHSPPAASGQPAAWVPLTHGLDQARWRLVAVDPGDAYHVYAGSDRLLYRSPDGGRHWQVCFRAPLRAQLLDVAIDPSDSQHVVLAATDGVYASTNGGDRWQRVFHGHGACRVARFHPLQPGQLWIGTAQGLFQSVDGGRHWQPMSLSNHSVTDLAIDPRASDRLYALTERGLWAHTPNGLMRLFSAPAGEEVGPEADEGIEESIEEPITLDQLTGIALDPRNPDHVYLASTQGMLSSQDAGQTWQRATQLGLGSDEIRHLIVHARSTLVVATPKGVARLHPNNGRWEPLYAGLPTQAVYRLAASQSKIFAATDQGLFSLDLTEDLLAEGEWPSPREILGNFLHEPTIAQVQAHAITYAEVHPDKIRRWRRQAALQALLPSLDITFDRNLSIDDSIDEGSFPNFQILPTRDLDRNWDLTIGWDLSDLIWNDDQTSIDVRSKLMVQLRDDVMSDVTRTFFERRRLQVELLTDPPRDPTVQLDKELRLQELTALLDGFTGGWFSEQLRPDS